TYSSEAEAQRGSWARVAAGFGQRRSPAKPPACARHGVLQAVDRHIQINVYVARRNEDRVLLLLNRLQPPDDTTGTSCPSSRLGWAVYDGREGGLAGTKEEVPMMTQPKTTSLQEAAYVLDVLASGCSPDEAALRAAALALDTFSQAGAADR